MRRDVVAVFAVIGLGALIAATPAAAVIRVKDSEADEFNVAGNCTLREAIQTANTDANQGGCRRRNATGTADTVVIEGGEEYALTIAGNDDTNQAGDLDIAGKITLEVSGDGRATVDANEIDRAFHVLQGANLDASRLVVSNGKPLDNGFSNGGGAFLNNGRLTLSRSQLSHNHAVLGQATNGGALDLGGGRTTLKRVLIQDNDSGGTGAGISWSGGRLLIANSEIAQNVTDGVGGGISIGGTSDSDVLIKGSTISGNTSKGDGTNFGGGGIQISYFGEGILKATNVTISGNTSYSNGGGIYSYNGVLEVNGATIARNTGNFDGDVDGKGGGFSGGGVHVRNSIIDENEDASTVNPVQDCYVPNVFPQPSPAHNLVSPGGGCGEGGSNRASFSAGIGELGDYGGPTPTHKLNKDSLAIGGAGGDAPARDQRGVKRDSNPDIGAYER